MNYFSIRRNLYQKNTSKKYAIMSYIRQKEHFTELNTKKSVFFTKKNCFLHILRYILYIKESTCIYFPSSDFTVNT